MIALTGYHKRLTDCVTCQQPTAETFTVALVDDPADRQGCASCVRQLGVKAAQIEAARNPSHMNVGDDSDNRDAVFSEHAPDFYRRDLAHCSDALRPYRHPAQPDVLTADTPDHLTLPYQQLLQIGYANGWLAVGVNR